MSIPLEPAHPVHPALRPVGLTHNTVFLVEVLPFVNHFVRKIGSDHRAVIRMDQSLPSRHIVRVYSLSIPNISFKTSELVHSPVEISRA